MRRRAEQAGGTRQRIVQATVELHGSVGPAATTIAAIADRAGVTRLTVYRHFPDEAALFGACSAHWISRQQLPDPGTWSQIGDPAARLRAGLTDLYRFYRAGAGMLTRIYRDFAALPEAHQRRIRDGDTYFRDVLTAPFGGTEDERRRLRAVIGHATSFWTWRSLCIDQGLSDTEAVGAMTGIALAVTPVPQAEPAQGDALAARQAERPRRTTTAIWPSRPNVPAMHQRIPAHDLHSRRHNGCT
jgi:AcrR family transcriptional regulator